MDSKLINGLKIFYRKNSSDEYVIKDNFDDKIFERGFPEYKINDTDLIIDIGAHIGIYSLILSQQLSNGLIYAIEPCLETFNYLKANVEINKITNIKIFKSALSDHVGETKLFYDLENGNWGHSITRNFSSEGEIVKMDTLANFFQINNIKKCDFIKFNCEGAEFGILLSCPIEVLKKVKNMLVLYHLDLISNYTLEELIKHLQSAGFYTEIRQKSYDEKRGWLIVMRKTKLQTYIFIGLSRIKSLVKALIYRIQQDKV